MTQYPHGIKLKTEIPLARIEDWLGANCKGDYHITTEGVTDDLSKRIIDIFFEDEADKEYFRRGYALLKKG